MAAKSITAVKREAMVEDVENFHISPSIKARRDFLFSPRRHGGHGGER
jgi:hypothetical protein